MSITATRTTDGSEQPAGDLYARGGATHGKWRDDFERITARLEPFVIVIEGESFIDPEATPGPLAQLYDKLLTVGYAHGWIGEKE